jgi:tRNA1(Val) A37 N6-methylase TrmN6
LAYFDPRDLADKQTLDLGSGNGASAMILAPYFPNASIAGVELVKVANARSAFYMHSNVSYLLPPNGHELP